MGLKKINRQYIFCKCDCGQIIISHDKYGRPRSFVHGHQINIDNPNKGGSASGRWKGGRLDHNGYVLIYDPRNPSADCHGYVYEHRLIIEEYLDRRLTELEIIHHKNGVKNDNRIENLELMTDSKHKSHHAIKRGLGVIIRRGLSR